jgi:hypothetical protein
MSAKVMTFEEFQDTRKYQDLSSIDESADGVSGYTYLQTGLYIEDTRTWENDERGDDDRGRWFIMIGRSDWSSHDLQELERHLYEFAINEGYILSEDHDVEGGGMPPEPKICGTSGREELIAWLEWNDRNGDYSDEAQADRRAAETPDAPDWREHPNGWAFDQM